MGTKTAKLSEHDEAVAKKRVFAGAVRKLRTAVEAGEISSAAAITMRQEWVDGGEIPKEWLG